MIHDSKPVDETVKCKDDNTDEPGRMRDAHTGEGQYQSACELKSMCEKRAKQGYNSGMGLIFRKVAGIGMYKNVCLDGEEPMESEESEESMEKSEESENACAGKNRGQCKEPCTWNGASKECLSE